MASDSVAVRMHWEAILKYPVVFAAGLLTVLAVTPLWRRVAAVLGFMDRPGGRKIHDASRPVGGGVAVFVGFHVACAVVFLLPWKPFSGQISIDWWLRFIPLSFGVLALGLLDDRFGCRPGVKLAAQAALAMAAYALNIRVQNVLGLNLPEWIDFVGTVLWFLAIMNSFNLIDGIDGLASGIALIASVGVGVSLLFRQLPGDVLLFLGLAGACLGFLRYNFYPASVFLGDAGSLFLGFTLAALTISTSSKGPALAAIGMPMLAVGVPLFDSALAVWRRSMRRVLGGSGENGERVAIDQGDADHLHHRLLGQGRRHDQVAWLLYAATALLALTGILTTVFNDKAIGILGIAFVVTAYTVVRHLSWIELRDTGEVVLQGLAKPVRRNLTLIFYILSDLLILNIAWLTATLLLDLQGGGSDLALKRMWVRSFPADIVVPFMVLMSVRAYSRAWSLAGIVEYASLGMAGLLGGVLSCATGLILLPPGGNPWSIVLHKLIFIGMALPGLAGTRAFLRVVQSLMVRPASGDQSGGGNRPRVLVAGSGPGLMLYFRYQAAVPTAEHSARIVGLVSDDEALCGHYIEGVRVLGLPRDLSALVQKHRVQAVFWMGEIEDARLNRIQEGLRGTGVRLVQWQLTRHEWTPDE